MKKATRTVIAVVVGCAFAASAALAGEIPFSGFLGDPDVYKKLGPGPEGGAKLRWVDPNVDPRKYDKYMVDSVIFYMADNTAYKGIDPQEMKDLADQFNKEIVAAFKDKWPLVAEPGPDVARISIAITNIKPSKPGRSAISSIIPIGLAVSLVKKGATGGWSGSGETCIEVKVMDSMTDNVIMMAVDQKKAAFEQRFSKWGSAHDAFKFWAERSVWLIDQTHGIKREPNK